MSIFGVMTTEGGHCFAFPDVCKTPAPPAPFVPVPYPNVAQCADGSGASKVKVRGKPPLRKGDKIRMSSGDEAGCAGGGMVSASIKGPATVKGGSSKVKIEGRATAHHTVPVAQNGNNANMPMGIHIAPSQMKVKVMP